MLVSASDPVAAALGSALDGLALRQRVAADNIANIDTPGFTAATLDFESSLRSALADGEMTEGDVLPTTEPLRRPGRRQRQQRRPGHRDDDRDAVGLPVPAAHPLRG